jgi:hypothetical protein
MLLFQQLLGCAFSTSLIKLKVPFVFALKELACSRFSALDSSLWPFFG